MAPLAQKPSAKTVSPPDERLKRFADHANAPSNRSRRSRICSQMGFVQLPFVKMTSWRGSFTGSVRSSRLSTIEKIAVFAAMPSER